MSRFLNWAMNKAITEAAAKGAKVPQQQAAEVEQDFMKARKSLESLVDDRFRQIGAQLQKSFSSQAKVDQVSTTKIVNTLMSIANHLKKVGGLESPSAQPSPVVDHIVNLLNKAEMIAEDTSAMKIQSVNQYLNQTKTDIMRAIDQVLQGLQRDIIDKSLSNVSSQIGQLQGTVGSIDKRLQVMRPEEQEIAFDGLAQVGNALHLQKRKFGGKIGNVMKIMAGPGAPLTFDPNDEESIMQSMQKLQNPKATRILLGDKQEITVDFTNPQSVSRALAIINGRGPKPSIPTPTNPEPVEFDPNMQAAPLQPVNNTPRMG